MRTPRTRFVIISLVALGTVIITGSLIFAKPPVSLVVVSYNTNRWADAAARRTVACAIIAITNNTKSDITYWADGSQSSPIHGIQVETPTGWKPLFSGGACGTGIQEHPLSPGHGFTFEVVVRADQRCKVLVNYSDGRQPDRMRKLLPSWLAKYLPPPQSWSIATTDAIDLRCADPLTQGPNSQTKVHNAQLVGQTERHKANLQKNLH
jgi:hypothetical protein